MRARDILFEDNRSKIQKLQELIDHPSTEDTVRNVAISRLKLLRSQEPVAPSSRITVETNVEEADLDRQFLTGVSLGGIYDGLCALSPAPNKIHFLRQGSIQMMVPPPFMGKTKQQYLSEIMAVCQGAKEIQSRMVEGQGYFFSISYL